MRPGHLNARLHVAAGEHVVGQLLVSEKWSSVVTIGEAPAVPPPAHARQEPPPKGRSGLMSKLATRAQGVAM